MASRRDLLHPSEGKYKELFENANDAIFILDKEQNYVDVNNRATELFGFTKDEFLKLNVRDVIPEQQAADSDVEFTKLKVNGQYEKFIGRQRTKDGRWLDIEVNSSLIIEDGQAVGSRDIVRDITDRKKMEQELIQEKNKLEAVMSAVGDGITVQDKELKILYQNNVQKERQGEHVGDYCYVAYHGKAIPCEGCLVTKCFEDGQIHRRETVATPAGKDFYMEVTASPLRDSSGEIVAAVETVRDITSQKLLEKKLRQAQKMEAIGTMAGGIAHDFNNILSVIINANQMLSEDLPESSQLKYFSEMALKAADRAKELVKQILAFSRQAEQQLLPVKPTLLVKENLKLLRSTIPTTVSIMQDIESEDGYINADPTQIHQLIMNLCTNAVHAMEEKGTLEVALREVELSESDLIHSADKKPGRYFKLSVSDDGCGMSKQEIEQAFDPFYTTKGPGEGTGMGLAVVHGIVESHGGLVQLESKLGQGTTFNVYFPLIEFKEEEREKLPQSQVSKGNETILLVDDEEMLAQMSSQMLERMGYNVSYKTSSADALEVFKASPDAFDVVITDQSMPNMSGAELAAEMLKIKPDMPIILATGYSKKISEQKAKNIGIQAFLLKPLDKIALAKSIRKVLHS